MTTLSAFPETVYSLTGATLGPFSTVFPFEDAGDLQVWLDTGAGPQKLGPLGYTVLAASPLVAGGTVTLAVATLGGLMAWPAGSTVALIRATDTDQAAALGEAIGFQPSIFEAALDHLERQIQDQVPLQSRTLRVPPGESIGTLPPLAARVGFAAWDGAGNLIGVAPPVAVPTDILYSDGRAVIGSSEFPATVQPGYDGDITVAMGLAAASGASEIVIPGGRNSRKFTCGNVVFTGPVKIRGIGQVTIWWTPGVAIGDGWTFQASDIDVENLRFQADEYTGFAYVPLVDSQIKVNALGPGVVNGKFNADKIRMRGASLGIDCYGIDEVNITRYSAYNQYVHGLGAAQCRRVIIDGVRIDGSGQECIKTGVGAGTYQVTEQVIIDNYNLTNSGSLNPSRSLWAEAIDLLLCNGQDVMVGNGHIINCANGGVELKTDVYPPSIKIPGAPFGGIRNVYFGNMRIVMGWDHGTGLELDFGASTDPVTGFGLPAPPDPDLSQKTLIENVSVYYRPLPGEPATAAVVQAVQILAWTDVTVSNLVTDGMHTHLRLDGLGSTDGVVRRTKIAGGSCRNAGAGIVALNGTFEDLVVQGGHYNAGQPIDLGGGAYTAAGTVIRPVLRDAIFISSNVTHTAFGAIFQNCYGLEADGCTFEADLLPVQVRVLTSPAGASITYTPGDSARAVTVPLGGEIRNCVLRTRLAGLAAQGLTVADGGSWKYVNNRLQAADDTNFVGWTASSGVVLAAGNLRGLLTAAPAGGQTGALGDRFANGAPATGAATGWAWTAAGWKAEAALA